MNAIEKFAKEHGADYSKKMAPLYKKAVQDTIGDIGKVRQAWTYTGSDEYGYVDWEASVVKVDGMLPEDEIVIVLSTDLENGQSWICGRYMDEYDTIVELDETSIGDPFDAVAMINELMAAVQDERSSQGESKKNEKGTTNIETYDGFEELIGYADAEYLLEDVVDVLSKYYAYEGEGDDIVFDEDQAKDDPEFTIKIEGGDERADYYYENIFYVHLPNKEAAEELAKVLGGELSESKKPESCKDGKKESMERCDSCGAVMTEYDYDRYGGLCKRCRDKGEAKKPAESSKKSEEVINNLTLPEAKKIYADVHKNHWNKPKFAELMDRCVADEDCGDLIDYLMGVYGTDIRDTLSEDDELLRLGFTLVDDWREEHGQNESRKKSEGIGNRIKMGIDYNMFMRMCRTAAYLDEDEDYWDALWEYYSETGDIEDALVFFDNLFQYTAWCDADEVYDEYLDDKFKDKSKSKEECIDAAIDDGDLDAYKHEKGNYLVIL